MKSKIITTPNPKLRVKSERVREITPEIREIVSEMIKASIEWEREHEFELSAALAAPQMGYNYRIIIVREDMGNKENASFIALINPEIVKNEGKVVMDYEGCLSVPKVYGLVPRQNKTRVKALLEDGTEVRLKATDFLARTLQHEVDHLDGVLFIDHIKGDPDAFFELDEKGELRPLDYDKHIKGNKTLFPDE